MPVPIANLYDRDGQCMKSVSKRRNRQVVSKSDDGVASMVWLKKKRSAHAETKTSSAEN